MSLEHIKTPLAFKLPAFTRQKIADAFALTGKALPASIKAVVSSGIVEVQFELANIPFTLPPIIVPVQGSEYVRVPYQVGCLGVVRPADARLGGVSGQGGGTPDLTAPASLGALVFEPIGNVDWPNDPAVDPMVLTMYGPAGALLRTPDGTASVGVSAASVSLVFGSHSIVIDSSGIKFDGKPYLAHEHIAVMSGSDTSGGVVNP